MEREKDSNMDTTLCSFNSCRIIMSISTALEKTYLHAVEIFVPRVLLNIYSQGHREEYLNPFLPLLLKDIEDFFIGNIAIIKQKCFNDM